MAASEPYHRPVQISHFLKKPIIKNKEDLDEYVTKNQIEKLLDEKINELKEREYWLLVRLGSIKKAQMDLIRLRDPLEKRGRIQEYAKKAVEKEKEINRKEQDIKLNNKQVKQLKEMISLIGEKYREIEPADDSWVLLGGRIRKSKIRKTRKSKNTQIKNTQNTQIKK